MCQTAVGTLIVCQVTSDFLMKAFSTSYQIERASVVRKITFIALL